MKSQYFMLLLSCSLLASCGGGSGSSSGGKSVSGYVLDGPVGEARVCLDLNDDNQCTSADEYTTTDSDGFFSLSISNSSDLTDHQLIADIRYTESTDADYSESAPDYDFVMAAFDSEADEVVISPLTTYLEFQQKYYQKSSAEVLSDTLDTILENESFSYATSSSDSEISATMLIENFVSGQTSDDTYLADFNTRLHNLNEVIAREMQESQAVWEDRFYSGELDLDSDDWSDVSTLIVNNANATTFTGFEVIVEQVTSYDFSDFDAESVSDTIWQDVPDESDIQNLIDYIDTYTAAENELAGNVYKYNIYVDGDLTSSNYYIFSDDTLSYYSEIYLSGETYCYSGSVSADFSGISESDFLTSMNESIDAYNDSYGDSGNYISEVTEVSSAPVSCSSYSSLLDDFNVADAIEDADEGMIYTPMTGTDYQIPDMPDAMIVSNEPTISSGSSGSTTAPASLSSCNYGNKKYAMNNCRTASVKN